MKLVLTSIQPYYVFLIIAHTMGWNIPQQKSVEVRKNFPKAENWGVIIYCTKSKRSFKHIPKEYQPLMAPLLGKVIGEFVCDAMEEIYGWELDPYRRFKDVEEDYPDDFLNRSCLSWTEIWKYRKNMSNDKPLYGWHISELKIYDKPKQLSDYYKSSGSCGDCKYLQVDYWDDGFCNKYKQFLDYYDGYISCEKCCKITRPPQSWCYVEE